MTQLTDTPAPFPAAVDAQALIEEARRHRRKRWRQAGFCVRHAPSPAGDVGWRGFWRATHATDGCAEGRIATP